MKMPVAPIAHSLFAPCGMNCLVCYKYCYSKKPCAGCLESDKGKPEHCRRCNIKDCVKEKGFLYCYECEDYPCKRLKALEKSYTTRYGASLLANSRFVKENGLTAFLAQQREAYRCPACGGIISLHDGECSQCQRKK